MGLSENVNALASRISTEVKSLRAAMVDKSIVNAKGDLIVASENDLVTRFPVGATTGYVLAVDPASSVGISWVAPTSNTPSNMVTTDSNQTISGPKTFTQGALLMTANGVTAEPYSDANPPYTLNISDQATPPPSPPTGQATVYSPDGLSLRLKDAGGADSLIGPSIGGGASSADDSVLQSRLTNWRQALANRRTTKVSIVTIGDSIMEGTGTVVENNRWLARFAAAYGAAPDEAFVPAYHPDPAFAEQYTRTGTITERNLFGIGRRAVDMASGATMTRSFLGDRVEVHYGKDNAFGGMRITIDGIAQPDIATSNASFQGGFIWQSPTLGSGLHTITITAVGATVRFMGIKPYNGTLSSGVHLYEGGYFGATANQWNDNGFGSPSAANGMWPSDYAAVNPDLVIIGLMANDYFFQQPVATYQSNLAFFVSKLRELCANDPSFLFVVYPQRSDNPATITYTYQQYVDAMIAVAGSDADIDVLDLRSVVPRPGIDTDAIWFDQVHPTAKGHQRIADTAFAALGDSSFIRESEWRASTGTESRLPADYTSQTPAAPASGVTLFARHRARRLLASVGPNGLDTAYQPSLFSNRVARLGAIPAVAIPQLDHLAVAGLNANVANTTGAGTAVTSASSPAPFNGATLFNSMIRVRYTTTAAVGIGTGVRSAVAQWHLSSTANKGGFFYVARFGLSAVNASNRVFVGLSSTTTALAAATDPSAFTNMIGFGANAAHGNLWFMASGATAQTATHVNLGTNYPTTSAPATWFYEVRLFAPSGGGQICYWSIHRINDGVLTQGQVTTALPANDTMLSAHMHHSTGTVATAVSLDVQSLYIESDN